MNPAQMDSGGLAWKRSSFVSRADYSVALDSADRDEIHRALKKHSGNLCIHFTGSLPPDTGVIF